MSVNKCIDYKVQAGVLTSARANKIKAYYQKQLLASGPTPSPMAIQMAMQQAVTFAQQKLAKKRQQIFLQSQVIRYFKQELDATDKPWERLLAEVSVDPRRRWNILDFDSQLKSTRSIFFSKFGVDLKTVKRAIDNDELTPAIIAQELDQLGSSGNPLGKQFAEGWQKARDYSVKQYKAAGGNLMVRADYDVPHVHSAEKIKAVSKDDWINAILPELDLAKHIDPDTGQALTQPELRFLLEQIYDNIVTDGLNKPFKGAVAGAKKLANRHDVQRFIHFKDAQAWIRYNERFGQGSVLAAMQNYLEGMARDTTLMMKFGPNPRATERWVGAYIERRYKELDKPETAAGVSRKVRTLFRHVMGSPSEVGNQTVANVSSDVRNWFGAVVMGGVTPTAIVGDGFGTNVLAAFYNGTSYFRYLENIFQQLDRSQANREAMLRMGIVAEDYADNLRHALTGELEDSTERLSAKAHSLVHKWSGTSGWTRASQQAGRRAANLEIASHLKAGTAFDQLPPKVNRWLSEAGVDAGIWDLAKSVPTFDYKGAPAFSPRDIAEALDARDERRAFEVAQKLHGAVMRFSNEATLMGSTRITNQLKGDAVRGTLGGEFRLFQTQFLTFPFEYTNLWIARAASKNMTAGERAQLIGMVGVLAIMTGATIIQAKAFARGEDFQNMNPIENPGFWIEAFMAGGGATIYGDMLANVLNGYGTAYDEVAKLALGAAPGGIVQQVSRLYEDAKNGGSFNEGAIVDAIGRNTPLLSSIWYIRAAYNRIVIETMKDMVDPDYNKRVRKRIKDAKKRGTSYWWAPDRALPNSLPGVSPAPSDK